jgi:hypothetical protein
MLEPVVFQSLARESLLLFQCGFLLETAVCLHGRLCEGFFLELEGGLLLVGLQYGVKDRVGEDVLAVVQVVVGSEFYVDVVSLYCVEMCAFFPVMEDLHRVVSGIEGMCVF